MGQYTYTLLKNENRSPAPKTAYRMEQLKGMTTYQMQEICRQERLVVPMGTRMEKEELIRFIMRYRGIREHRHIREYAEGGLDALQDFLEKIDLKPDLSASISFPSHLTLYEGEGIEITDHYAVEGDSGLYEGNVLMVDENFQIYTCFYLKKAGKKGFHLMKGKNVPILQADGHRYSLLYFKREEVSDLLYDIYHGEERSIPSQVSCILTPLLGIDIRPMEETDLPLIIDFGSSNTTLGMYGPDGSTRIVRAVNHQEEDYPEREMIPTVIGIRDVVLGNPVFVFGYEARELAEQAYQDEDCPVFYDIKRWISAPDRIQQIVTRDGIRMEIVRREMLTAFMHYLIATAQQQFKCIFRNIQLLTPVRQKNRFAALFKELLPQHSVDCSLDEGMAVLFHSINEMIKSDKYKDGVWYQALIMDCGGGTTDLTSGRFRIRNNRISYEIDLETGYENGNTNFGGNNLTFRILQLMKIKFLEALGYRQFAYDLETGMGVPGHGYDTLNRLYEEAENYLPTRYAGYEKRGKEEYFRIKNNYYYLFRMAETIKESFFQKAFRYELRVGTEAEIGKNPTNQKAIILDKWRLSVRGGGQLAPLRKEAVFSLYLYEIEYLLRPDIYELMSRFLEKLFIKGELSAYGMLKLTGQSCKSSLFNQGLKEYVPGRLIRNERESDIGSSLKMCCLEGAISYFNNCKLGLMKVNQGYTVNALPYEVMAYTHENKEKVLIRSLWKEQDIGYISRFKIGEQLDLTLHDERGRQLKIYHFTYDMSQFEKVTQEDFDEKYTGTVIQEETDVIVEGEIKFFVWPSRELWGFMVLPVLRENDLLYQGEETFFAFEDDTWEENFFDGKK